MLLSSGKDGRTILWNPNLGTILGEFPIAKNWSFESQWSPINPELVFIASSDSVKVCGISMANIRLSEDPFTSSGIQQTQVVNSQAPKWLKRPCSAVFGFGGRLVSISRQLVVLRSVITFPELVQRSHLLTKTLRESSFSEFCDYRLSVLPKESQERVVWNVLKILFEPDSRQRLMEYLGFTKERILEKMANISLPPLDSPKEDEFSRIASSPFSMYQESSEEDALITKAILVGDFESAVKICLARKKMTDAFLIALLGGPDLLSLVQEQYLASNKTPYLRLVSNILSGRLEDVVKNCDLSEWKDILAYLCTFSKNEDFASLLSILGARLLNTAADKYPAIICFLAGGNMEGLIKLFTSKLERPARSSQLWDYALGVAQILETLVVFRLSMNGSFEGGVPPTPTPVILDLIPLIPSLTTLYSQMLIEQGEYQLAVTVLNGAECPMEEGNEIATIKDRLYNLWNVGWTETPQFPFSSWNEPPEVPTQDFYSYGYQAQPSSGQQFSLNGIHPPDFSQPGMQGYNSSMNQQNQHYSAMPSGMQAASLTQSFPPVPSLPPFNPSGHALGASHTMPATNPYQTSFNPAQNAQLPAGQYSSSGDYAPHSNRISPSVPSSNTGSMQFPYSSQAQIAATNPYGTSSQPAPPSFGQTDPSMPSTRPPLIPAIPSATNSQDLFHQSSFNASKGPSYPTSQQRTQPALVSPPQSSYTPTSNIYGSSGQASSINMPMAPFPNMHSAPSMPSLPLPGHGSQALPSPSIPPATEAIHSSSSSRTANFSSSSAAPSAQLQQKVGGYNDPPTIPLRTGSFSAKTVPPPIVAPFATSPTPNMGQNAPYNQSTPNLPHGVTSPAHGAMAHQSRTTIPEPAKKHRNLF